MAYEVEASFKSPTIRSPHSRAYWEGLREGRLVLQRCVDCGAWTHPPGPNCTSCLSTNKKAVTLSGRGTIYTYTVTRRAMHPEFKADLPYVIVYVKTEEGPMLVSWLVGIAPDDVRIGMPVEAEFERIDDRTTLHRFRPVGSVERKVGQPT
jgi:uncharacterized OB-fold protein